MIEFPIAETLLQAGANISIDAKQGFSHEQLLYLANLAALSKCQLVIKSAGYLLTETYINQNKTEGEEINIEDIAKAGGNNVTLEF